jgi:hypothetical protein
VEISDQDYSIRYDETAATVYFQGTLRLIGVQAYVPLTQLLDQVIELEPPLITIDLLQLKTLNSSGVTTLAKFVIKVNKKDNIEVLVRGHLESPWQQKSLANLKRLMPRLQLEWE